MAGKIFSAEAMDASVRHERRIRIRNRKTGETYFRPYHWIHGTVDMDDSMREKVLEIHTSPFLAVRFLWYDPALKMLFFEVTRRTPDGRSTPD